MRYGFVLMLALAGSVAAGAPAQPAEDEIYVVPPRIAPPLPSPPPPPLTPEHLRLAQRLAGLIVMSEIAEEVVRTPPPPPADDGNPHDNPPIRATRSAAWNVASAAATTYARLYSVDELRPMIAFFESPAGQKYLSARRQGVVSVMHVFERLPWYTDLYYRQCGGREFCRWKPAESGGAEAP